MKQADKWFDAFVSPWVLGPIKFFAVDFASILDHSVKSFSAVSALQLKPVKTSNLEVGVA